MESNKLIDGRQCPDFEIAKT